MNGFFPLPLFSFIRIVIRNGGLKGKGVLRSSAWFIKTVLFEPLRWIELLTKSKRIRNHKIEYPPVFILGYYRSGTTYLQELFMQDDRLGFMSAYQTIFPEIMLTCEKWMTPMLEFFTGLFNRRNVFHRKPFSWNSTGEEDLALTTGMSPLAAQWGYFFPEKMLCYFEKYVMFENITDSELQAWKKVYFHLLKKISLANKGKPLVLKNPPNTARIKLLLSLFPDASFVFIRRNPYDLFASKKRLLKALEVSYCLGRACSVEYDRVITETFSRLMYGYLKDKALITQGKLVEIEYKDLLHEPVKTMKYIYESLQMDDFSHCETKMSSYIALQKHYKVLQHKLEITEESYMSEKCGSIIRELGYPVL